MNTKKLTRKLVCSIKFKCKKTCQNQKVQPFKSDFVNKITSRQTSPSQSQDKYMYITNKLTCTKSLNSIVVLPMILLDL